MATREIMRPWLKQSLIVIATFALIAFLMALAVFSNAPRIWSGSALVALAAGAGGWLGWLLLCGIQSRPAWWRTIAAGILAGVALHPFYLLLECFYAGEMIALSDFLMGSMFFLLVGGIISVPAGVAAAVACRIFGAWGNPSLDEQSDTREPE